jgi:Leucine-rich repeat (LRR) protein
MFSPPIFSKSIIQHLTCSSKSLIHILEGTIHCHFTKIPQTSFFYKKILAYNDLPSANTCSIAFPE